MFKKQFAKYACPGDSIECEIDGLRVVATIHEDSDHGNPWDNSDCHGPVTKWIRRGKNAGERVLSEDRGAFRYYDFAGAVKTAKAEGWGIAKEGESNAQRAARMAEHDFEVLRAWCNDEWNYCGISVQVFHDDIELTGEYDHALWGIELNYPESGNEYLNEVAGEYLVEAVAAAKIRAVELKESLANIS